MDTALLLNFGSSQLEIRRHTWFANRLPASVAPVAPVDG